VQLGSGKIYYELAAERDKRGLNHIAIMRMERLYPLPARTLPPALAQYPNAELVWVQEEPANQGAWSFLAMNLPAIIDRPLRAVTRPASSTPAVGAHHRHEHEQKALVDEALS
jgi:2-oxoglutarate dehydrogenase E1 component